jgi:hypothetical protein
MGEEFRAPVSCGSGGKSRARNDLLTLPESFLCHHKVQREQTRTETALSIVSLGFRSHESSGGHFRCCHCCAGLRV